MKSTKIIILIILILAVVLIWARLMLPYWAKDYVNKVLSNIHGYNGSVADVDIHLWRGAYTLYDIKINKETGKIPVPFVAIPVMDLSVEWKALMHGAVVASVDFKKPVINFAVSRDGKTTQTGKEGNWADSLNKLVPIEINLVTATDGKITYRDFSARPEVNIFIKDLDLQARNLQSVEDKEKPLPSSFVLKGNSIGKGNLAIDGHANILKNPLDFDLNGKIENINLPDLNNYFREYAFIDFEKGTLHVYTELQLQKGQLTGYVKPLAKDVTIVKLTLEQNPIKLFWETLVGTVATIFKNQPKDQLATKIPISGNLSDPKINLWPTIVGIFRNAFVQAYKNDIDNSLNAGSKN